MRLTQIADVVIDAAALVPMRDQPDVARQHHKKHDRETDLDGSHRLAEWSLVWNDKDLPPCTGKAPASIAMREGAFRPWLAPQSAHGARMFGKNWDVEKIWDFKDLGLGQT